MGTNELIWEEWRILPNSSVGTNFEAIDLIAMNEVPLKISTIEPEKKMNLLKNIFKYLLMFADLFFVYTFYYYLPKHVHSMKADDPSKSPQ